MFYISLMLMLISSITGGILLYQENYLYGAISLAFGILLFLFIFTYYRKKLKSCTPDCGFFDCDHLDCDGPDCG